MSLAKLLSPRPCELGKIKIGGLGEERKGQGGGTYRLPEKYDHFVITTLYRGEDGKLREDAALMASLKEYCDADGKLRTLPVALLSNDIEEVLQASYLWYDGKKLAAKSDGEMLTKFADMKTGQWLPQPETVPWKPEWADLKDGKGNPRFKLHCTMNVVIASREAKWGGFYKFRTTSRITADQLYGSLVQLRQLTGGILRGLPLRLIVRPLQVAPNGKPTTVYVVHVELAGSDVAAIQKQALEIAQHEVQNAKQLAAAQAEYRQLLRSPDEFLDDDEEAEVAQEFAPHQQPGQLPPHPVQTPAPEGEQGADPTPAPSAGAMSTTPNVAAPSPEPSAPPIDWPKELSELERSWASNALDSIRDAFSVSDVQEVLASMPAREKLLPVLAGKLGIEGKPTAMALFAATRPAKPMPAAERRTRDDEPLKAGQAIIQVLLGLMHPLDVNWSQIRDGVEKGGEIAAAAGLAKMPVDFKITDLTAAEALALKSELEQHLAAKKGAAAKRAAKKEVVS